MIDKNVHDCDIWNFIKCGKIDEFGIMMNYGMITYNEDIFMMT